MLGNFIRLNILRQILCQDNWHFLGFSDTVSNARHRKCNLNKVNKLFPFFGSSGVEGSNFLARTI